VLRRNAEASDEHAGGETEATDDTGAEPQPDAPVMPSPPFPTFQGRPTLPHQAPGMGFESGRDSRAR
jgi:hypothetical protein